MTNEHRSETEPFNCSHCDKKFEEKPTFCCQKFFAKTTVPKEPEITKQVPPVVDLSFEDQVNNNVSGESIGAAGMVTHTKFSNWKTIQMLQM